MQSLGRCYVSYINSSYERTGTLWEGRFKASLLDSEHYFLTLSRYIELKPVRANMTQSPDDYPWSNFQCNALGKPIKLITPHPIYLQLSKSAEERQTNYQALLHKKFPTTP